MDFVSIYCLLVGIGMIGFWGFVYVTKQIPELKTEPVRIYFHIAVEILTGCALLIGLLSLVFQQSWARSFILIALGMLLYTAVISPGYYAQQGKWSAVGMFAFVFVLTVACAVLLI